MQLNSLLASLGYKVHVHLDFGSTTLKPTITGNIVLFP